MNVASLDLHPAVGTILFVLGLGLLIFLTSPFLAQLLLFLPPRQDPGDPPVLNGIAGEEVRLETADGVSIHGWWYSAEAPASGPDEGERSGPPAVLALHGNAGSIAGRTMLAEGYLADGISVLLLSYRGYGRSEGRSTLAGVPLDARAGLEFLTEQSGGPDRVVVHGRSLGGAVGLSALRTPGPPPAGFILESSFTSLDQIAGAVYPFFPAPILRRLRGRLDALGALRDFDGPVLVIHGGQDNIIPPDMSRTLHEEARDSRGLWIVDNAGHNDLEWVAGREHRERVSGFVHEVTRN